MRIEEIVYNNLSPEAPAYENNISTNFIGYNLVLSFPTCPVPEEKRLAFPAYIKKIDDSFNIKYDDKRVYGRMDPIPVYNNTTRTIKFDLALPSNGLAHSMDIGKKLNILVKNLYPSYQKNGNVNVISSPPLVSVFFSNLIYESATDSTLLGYFQSGVSITHDLEKGVFARGEGYEVYPRAYNLSFTMNVLHYYTPGYVSVNGAVKNQLNILKSLR